MARSIVVAVAAVAALAAPAAAEDRAFLEAASKAYYSLQREGLASFACSIRPNWDLMLAKEFRSDPERGKNAHAALSSLRFSLTVPVGGPPKFAYLGGDTPANPQQAKGFDMIKSGLEQALSGLFDIWSPYMLTQPFPAPGPSVQVVEHPEHWMVASSGTGEQTVTLVGKDYVVRSAYVTRGKTVAQLQPMFTPSPHGLLLWAFQGDYREAPPGTATLLQARVAYQEVDGLTLPKTINMSGDYGNAPYLMELGFADCRTNRR